MSELTIYDKEFNERVGSIATTLAKSALVPSHLRGKVADIYLILAMGNDIGLKPTMALQQINVIQGKPTMAAQLMIALVKKNCPDAKIAFELLEEKQEVLCKVKENRNDEEWDYVSTWNLAKAKQMNLLTKDNYRKQPMNMLKWRAASEAIRAVFPHALSGFYATEELQDFDGKEIDLSDGGSIESDIDKDFPIPENEKTIGPEYRVLNGKFRGKQLKDIDPIDLNTELERIEKVIEAGTQAKQWHSGLAQVIETYLTDIEEVTE